MDDTPRHGHPADWEPPMPSEAELLASRARSEAELAAGQVACTSGRCMRITRNAIGRRGACPAECAHCRDASWSNFCYTAGMERDQAIARLKEHEAELRQLGIEHLYLFGSTARGEAREDSDVDLFFDHPVGSIGLYELMDVKETASRILGRKADIMTRRSLHRVLRDGIEASALQVF
jgi:uncharacterized protein